MSFAIEEHVEKPAANPVQPYKSKLYRIAKVDGAWNQEVADYAKHHRIEGISIRLGRGDAGDDCSFLSDLPWLRYLSLSARKPSDVSPIGDLTSLEYLSISGAPRGSVDFSGLAHLEKCVLDWWRGADSIFDCHGLQSLYIHKLPAKFSTELASLKALKEMTLFSQSVASVEPISDISGLEKLELLGARKLASLDGIGNLTSLRSLTLDECGMLSDIRPLSALSALEHLVLSNWKIIDSLEPIGSLTRLRAFSFSGSRTNVADGDLSPLTKLPNLSMLMFGARRHYTHKLVKTWNWQNFSNPSTLLEEK